MTWSSPGTPSNGLDTVEGMHFCSMPTVPCSHVITGRGPGGGCAGASTVATAVAGEPSGNVVVYRIRHARAFAGRIRFVSSSLRINAPGVDDTFAGRV